MTRVLISGFDPQWGIHKSPSGDLAKIWLNKEVCVPDVEVHAIVLPQVFGKSSEILKAEAFLFQPDFILMYGATQKESPIRFERFALNIIDTVMGGNDKIPVLDTKVLHNGPAAYESNLPIKALVEHLKNVNISAIPSYSAGQHTCNELFYQMMHWLSFNPLSKSVGICFIHMAFPNNYGVIEDRNWKTPDFPELVRASMETVKFLSRFKAV